MVHIKSILNAGKTQKNGKNPLFKRILPFLTADDRIEPARHGHQILGLARLPVPPPSAYLIISVPLPIKE